jgi:formyl-CoA transferase
MGCFASADGYVNIAGPSGRLLHRFCEVIGRPDLPEDPRFSTSAGRSAHRAELNEIIAERLRQRTTAEWVRLLNDAGVPCGPVYRMDEVFADEQVRHLRMAAPVEHGELGRLDLVRNAVRISGTAPSVRTPIPELGADAVPVLTELGYTADEVAQLRARGAIERIPDE